MIFFKKSVTIYLLFCLILPCSLAFGGQRNHTVYFEGEENELHVYRIIGTQPGKTLLIMGGIQGDEPGGFLAADSYADFSLETGTLIVIPRANFPSILKNERQINQDMNRKFLDDNRGNYESRVVNVLKKIICEADCFLNLHEGSGVYSATWIDANRNPKRYGQSIIADDASLCLGGGGDTIDLEKMAQYVIKRINQNIKDPDYKFHFNNHRTNQANSLHKEQRHSATYYALNVCKIPAFGVESAKILPLEQKVRQHIHAINGFMDFLGIIPETPGIDLKKPKMQYMILSVNNSIPVVVGSMQRLQIKKGDTVQVHDIVANYERGLSVDVIGFGNRFNDMKRRLKIFESTRIVAKKDSYPCGSVFVDVVDKSGGSFNGLSVQPSKKVSTIKYKFKINGQTVISENYGRIQLNKGDLFMIEDIMTGNVDPSAYIVNFKGFVGNQSKNSGEDRGYLIDIGKDVLMPRFSVDKKGKRYVILTTLEGREVGKVFVDIQS